MIDKMVQRLAACDFVTPHFLWWQYTPLVKTQAAAKIEAATDAMLPTAAERLINYF